MIDTIRALLGYQKVEAPYEEILSGAPPGHTTERVHGRRISRRRALHAPSQWHLVITFDSANQHVIDEHWECERA